MVIKDKKLIYGILAVMLIGASLFLVRKVVPVSRYGVPQYCVNYLGESRPVWECADLRAKARKCSKIGECVPTCGHGCINKNYEQGLVDCEAMPEYDCECINGFCQVK